MNTKSFLLSLLVSMLVIVSCKESFDIIAPYKDITIAYGLLDLGEDTTFLRINKAFLGDGNVLEMVKVEDSSIYVNGLSASIEEWYNGSVLATYPLDTMTIDNKNEGLFYNPYQLLYYAVFEVQPDYHYKLKIIVKNKEVTGETDPVNDFSMTKPTAGSKFVKFQPEIPTANVEWESAKNGKRYEVVIRFNFKELKEESPDTIYRYIDWNLGTFKSLSTQGGEEMYATYQPASFYTILSNRVPYEDPVEEAMVTHRFTKNVEFLISVAGDELNTYMEVNEPTNSIVQEKPDYTNLTNGLGVFSSRFRKVRVKKIDLTSVDEIKKLNLKFEY